jgi:hypothetical protein
VHNNQQHTWRRRTLGAAFAATLALGLPLAASAHDDGRIGAFDGAQAQRLERAGMISSVDIATVPVGGTLPAGDTGELQRALGGAYTTEPSDSVTWTLADYLRSRGIDPSSVQAVTVADDGFVTVYYHPTT